MLLEYYESMRSCPQQKSVTLLYSSSGTTVCTLCNSGSYSSSTGQFFFWRRWGGGGVGAGWCSEVTWLLSGCATINCPFVRCDKRKIVLESFKFTERAIARFYYYHSVHAFLPQAYPPVCPAVLDPTTIQMVFIYTRIGLSSKKVGIATTWMPHTLSTFAGASACKLCEAGTFYGSAGSFAFFLWCECRPALYWEQYLFLLLILTWNKRDSCFEYVLAAILWFAAFLWFEIQMITWLWYSQRFLKIAHLDRKRLLIVIFFGVSQISMKAASLYLGSQSSDICAFAKGASMCSGTPCPAGMYGPAGQQQAHTDAQNKKMQSFIRFQSRRVEIVRDWWTTLWRRKQYISK